MCTYLVCAQVHEHAHACTLVHEQVCENDTLIMHSREHDKSDITDTIANPHLQQSEQAVLDQLGGKHGPVTSVLIDIHNWSFQYLRTYEMAMLNILEVTTAICRSYLVHK